MSLSNKKKKKKKKKKKQAASSHLNLMGKFGQMSQKLGSSRSLSKVLSQEYYPVFFELQRPSEFIEINVIDAKYDV